MGRFEDALDIVDFFEENIKGFYEIPLETKRKISLQKAWVLAHL